MWREFERGSERKTGRKRGSIRERGKSGERVCVFIFRLFCHKLFKGYILPTTHLGMRVKVEEFLLLSSPLNPPPNPFCWFLFFFFLFLLALISPSLASLWLLCAQTWQLLSGWPRLDINFMFCSDWNKTLHLFFLFQIVHMLMYFKCKNNMSHNNKHQTKGKKQPN